MYLWWSLNRGNGHHQISLTSTLASCEGDPCQYNKNAWDTFDSVYVYCPLLSMHLESWGHKYSVSYQELDWKLKVLGNCVNKEYINKEWLVLGVFWFQLSTYQVTFYTIYFACTYKNMVILLFWVLPAFHELIVTEAFTST